jgi:hypothetical protein
MLSAMAPRLRKKVAALLAMRMAFAFAFVLSILMRSGEEQ